MTLSHEYHPRKLASVCRTLAMTQAAQKTDDEQKWKGHGPRPVGPWPLARRVHELSLLVAVALLWCLAATSLFMSDATAPTAPTAAPALVPFERLHQPEVLAGEPQRSDVVRDVALASPQDADEPQPEPQRPQRSRLGSGQRHLDRNPRRDLRALQRLLRRSAGGLSDAQRAKYAASLHSALRRYAVSR